MKKKILAITYLLAILSIIHAEPYEIKLNEFNSISNSTPFDIEIRFSDRTYAEINLNEKSESYLKISIEDNRLIIESVKDDWWKFWKKISLRGTIYVYTQSSKFQFIENIGTGSMNFSDKISSSSLQVNLIGTGSIIFSGGGEVFNIRSEEHTSELQSRTNLVCRLLLEKKKNKIKQKHKKKKKNSNRNAL